MAEGVRPRRSAACARPPRSCATTRVRRVSKSRLVRVAMSVRSVNDGICSTRSYNCVKSANDRSMVWLMHMVGDIHQPLHCLTRVSATHPDGDRGGNLVLLNGPAKNLHFFWDDVLARDSHCDLQLKRRTRDRRPKALSK